MCHLLRLGEVRYISTGRFGDPNTGHYQEISDECFRILPLLEAREKGKVNYPSVLCRINCSGKQLQQQARDDAVLNKSMRTKRKRSSISCMKQMVTTQQQTTPRRGIKRRNSKTPSTRITTTTTTTGLTNVKRYNRVGHNISYGLLFSPTIFIATSTK